MVAGYPFGLVTGFSIRDARYWILDDDLPILNSQNVIEDHEAMSSSIENPASSINYLIS